MLSLSVTMCVTIISDMEMISHHAVHPDMRLTRSGGGTGRMTLKLLRLGYVVTLASQLIK